MSSKDSFGIIRINNDVVKTIASVELSKVEGLISTSGKRFLDPLRTQKGPDKSVDAEVEENRVKVSVSANILYGHNVYDTARRLQQRIKNAVEQMTGLIVETVDVDIADIVKDPDAKKGKGEDEAESEEAENE